MTKAEFIDPNNLDEGLKIELAITNRTTQSLCFSKLVRENIYHKSVREEFNQNSVFFLFDNDIPFLEMGYFGGIEIEPYLDANIFNHRERLDKVRAGETRVFKSISQYGDYFSRKEIKSKRLAVTVFAAYCNEFYWPDPPNPINLRGMIETDYNPTSPRAINPKIWAPFWNIYPLD